MLKSCAHWAAGSGQWAVAEQEAGGRRQQAVGMVETSVDSGQLVLRLTFKIVGMQTEKNDEDKVSIYSAVRLAGGTAGNRPDGRLQPQRYSGVYGTHAGRMEV